MANYHFEVQAISRGQGRSLTRLVNYISGERLSDCYNRITYYNRREDVLECRIFQPQHAPSEFYELQSLCNAIETAERRCDARTAREFKASLPNELPFAELQNIVATYITDNFIKYCLCAISAIHGGRNPSDPSKNNPHVHIIVPTRAVEPSGFSKKKDREHDKRQYIQHWREQWANVQNEAYSRCGLDIRVSHESLEVQGINRVPTIHPSRIDWQKNSEANAHLLEIENVPSNEKIRCANSAKNLICPITTSIIHVKFTRKVEHHENCRRRTRRHCQPA